MRSFGKKKVVSLVLLTVFCRTTIPLFASTDDNGKSAPPAKPAAAKVDAPAPLTERERWLLDRVELLEKRVADLESKGDSTAASAADVSAAQPPSANSATSVVASAPPSTPPGATAANREPPSSDRVAAIGPQATEKGKSGA